MASTISPASSDVPLVAPVLPASITAVQYLPPTPEGRARFSREAYHRLFEAGVLDSERRYELLDGEIMMMSPASPDNGALIRRLCTFFSRRLPDSLDCSVQLPITIGDHSEPEPDLAIIKYREDDYQLQHPEPSDVLLLIEVSKSSIKVDLGKKLTLYARAGITEYWVVDANQKVVIVHRQPSEAGYQLAQPFDSKSTIVPLCASECQLDLGWLFR